MNLKRTLISFTLVFALVASSATLAFAANNDNNNNNQSSSNSSNNNSNNSSNNNNNNSNNGNTGQYADGGNIPEVPYAAVLPLGMLAIMWFVYRRRAQA